MPLILGPIVTVLMCERAGIATSVQKFRKAVTDPSDGREWSVRYDGGQADIVCEKSPVSAAAEQVFAQYERLRQTKATANQRADAYREAYAKQKDTDTPELRESTRAEVERICKESEEADARFAAFEAENPQCLKKRHLSEAAYWRGKSQVEAKRVEVYEKAEADWQKKIDDAPGKDDNLLESLAGCQKTLEEHRARLDDYRDKLAQAEKAAAKIQDTGPKLERVTVPMGAAVCFA